MVRLSRLMGTYSWCRGEASSRAFAQSCACSEARVIKDSGTAEKRTTRRSMLFMRRSLEGTGTAPQPFHEDCLRCRRPRRIYVGNLGADANSPMWHNDLA